MQGPMLFAPDARNGGVWTQLAGHLHRTLARLEYRRFEDGEHKSRPLDSVRERDVYLLQSFYGDADDSPNDKLIRSLWLAGALRDAGASRVTLVAPYLCYARKDRRTQLRDPVSSRYLAQLIEAMGIARVVTLDVHNLAAFENAFRIPTEHLSALTLFMPPLVSLLGAAEVVVVSPDAGGIARAEALRSRLERQSGRAVGRAVMEKQRSGGVLSGDHLAGDVAGRVAVLIDDLVSTGATLGRAVRACRAHGATRVYALATHALLAAGAADTLAGMPLDALLLTDSLPPRELPASLQEKVRWLPVAPLLAAVVQRLHDGGSVAELLA
jgi:ribose-phosphate pyrophosphokinase